MALLFCDGFDSYTATADMVNDKWSSFTSSSLTYSGSAGRYGGGGASGVFGAGLTYTIPAAQQTSEIVLAMSMKMSGVPNADMIKFQIAGGSSVIQVNFNSGGVIAVYNTVSTLLGSTSTNICDDAWHHIEIHVLNHTSTGEVTVYVDGVSELALTSQNTGSTGNFQHVKLHNPSNFTFSIDDVLIYNDASGWPQHTADFPVGDFRIQTVRPDGAGNYGAWTPSAGANYQCVDEQTPNDNTDYVSSTASGNIDTYTAGALGVSPTTVHAVVVNVVGKNLDAGTADVACMVRSSTTDGTGATQTLGTDYGTIQEAFATDPATAVAWTEAGVNAMEIGVKNAS